MLTQSQWNVRFFTLKWQLFKLKRITFSDTEATFLDLHLSSNDIVSTKYYAKSDDFYFEIY